MHRQVKENYLCEAETAGDEVVLPGHLFLIGPFSEGKFYLLCILTENPSCRRCVCACACVSVCVQLKNALNDLFIRKYSTCHILIFQYQSSINPSHVNTNNVKLFSPQCLTVVLMPHTHTFRAKRLFLYMVYTYCKCMCVHTNYQCFFFISQCKLARAPTHPPTHTHCVHMNS